MNAHEMSLKVYFVFDYTSEKDKNYLVNTR